MDGVDRLEWPDHHLELGDPSVIVAGDDVHTVHVLATDRGLELQDRSRPLAHLFGVPERLLRRPHERVAGGRQVEPGDVAAPLGREHNGRVEHAVWMDQFGQQVHLPAAGFEEVVPVVETAVDRFAHPLMLAYRAGVDTVLKEKRDGYAILTLNDPDRRNVFTLDMSARLSAALDDLEADQSMRSVILTGAGKGFCSGGHLDELLANPGHDGLRRVYAGFIRLAESRLATIAAVNGAAVGAGMNAVLCCDVVIAAESARFDSRFLQIGIGPGGGHTWRLRNKTDLQTAKAMVLFSEVLDGSRAAEVGLAWRCVADDDLLSTAESMAARAASAPRELLMRTKDTIERTDAIDSGDAAVDNELDTQVWSMGQPAFQDMVARLRERMRR